MMKPVCVHKITPTHIIYDPYVPTFFCSAKEKTRKNSEIIEAIIEMAEEYEFPEETIKEMKEILKDENK